MSGWLLYRVQGVQCSEGQEEGLGPLLLLDTAGCDLDEQAEDGSGSKFNDGEAEVRSSASVNVYKRMHDNVL